MLRKGDVVGIIMQDKVAVCFQFLGSVCLLFLKTVFYSQKQEEQGKQGKIIYIFLCSENKESTKNTQRIRVFREHQNDVVLYVFKNCS